MSQFLKDKKPYHDETFRKEIDFEDAIKLPNGGTTCDIYRTRWQRREVFVKRLKKEHRTNPLYLDAMDKEYDIGVSLKHPSLPDYRELHRDYIVMDFIDGTTLADMIKKQDSWLKNEKNIVMILKELVEVTDYLHRHNVTHCDIKPDNIIITANNKNLVLIDLDKCYTWRLARQGWLSRETVCQPCLARESKTEGQRATVRKGKAGSLEGLTERQTETQTCLTRETECQPCLARERQRASLALPVTGCQPCFARQSDREPAFFCQ